VVFRDTRSLFSSSPLESCLCGQLCYDTSMTCFFAHSVQTSQRNVTNPSLDITTNHSNRGLTPTLLLNIILIEPLIMQQKQDPHLFPILHPAPFLLYSYAPLLPIPVFTRVLNIALLRARAPSIQ